MLEHKGPADTLRHRLFTGFNVWHLNWARNCWTRRWRRELGDARSTPLALLTGPGFILSNGLQGLFILPWLMDSLRSCFSSIKSTTAGKLHWCFMLPFLHSYIQEMSELCMNLSHLFCLCVFLGQHLKSKLFSVLAHITYREECGYSPLHTPEWAAFPVAAYSCGTAPIPALKPPLQARGEAVPTPRGNQVDPGRQLAAFDVERLWMWQKGQESSKGGTTVSLDRCEENRTKREF